MARSTAHETFRQIAVRAADAEQAERLAAEACASGATGLEARERKSVAGVLRAAGLCECGARNRVDANGDPWLALLTIR
ncbi:MAG: hypothetical protein IH974_01435 [Myxococcales bacterium]|nr:hypothetical protein [Myxococcales bacterium]